MKILPYGVIGRDKDGNPIFDPKLKLKLLTTTWKVAETKTGWKKRKMRKWENEKMRKKKI